MMKATKIFGSILVSALLSMVLLPGASAAERDDAERPEPSAKADLPPPPPPLPERGRKFRSGPGVWQAFSKLEPEERKKMQELQRNDPAKFREVMQAKAEELFRRRQARESELTALAEKCRKTENPAERSKLRARLVAEVEKDFREHLAANRLQLEEMKRRTARLERELNRREANCGKAVNALADAMISGEKIPDGKRPPRPGVPRPDGEALEK